MIAHAYVPHPVWKRDQCEFKYDDDGRVGHCGKPRSDIVHQEGAAKHRGATTTQSHAAQETASQPVVDAPAGGDPASPGSTSLQSAWARRWKAAAKLLYAKALPESRR